MRKAGYYPPETIVQETKPDDLKEINEDIKKKELASWIGNWGKNEYQSAFMISNKHISNSELEINAEFYNLLERNVLDKYFNKVKKEFFLVKKPIKIDKILPANVYKLGSVPVKAKVRPIGSFGSENTKECKKNVSDNDSAAYIIISEENHQYDFLWATCSVNFQIGITRNPYETDFILQYLNVVEVRRGEDLGKDTQLEIRLTEGASKMIGLQGSPFKVA